MGGTGTEPRTPLLLIGGGLGSGKTTLLRRLLSGEHGRIAVLVNEFGELGIDGDWVAGDDIDMVELAGGCVCCSLAGEFEDAVRELLDRFAPERIAVETTGVAEADALAMDIEEGLPEVRLDAVAILVDADVAARFPALGHAERAQLEAADLILVNKTDLVDAAALGEVRERVRAANPRARLVETVHAGIDPALLLGEVPRTGKRPAHRPEHSHEHGMTSFHWRPGGGLERTCLEAAVAAWPEAVYRAKGRLLVDGEHCRFNYVAGRWDLDPDRAGDLGLVWIGPGVDRHREAILERLEACLE